MLKDIIDLLNEDDWLVSDEDILIAKGKYINLKETSARES